MQITLEPTGRLFLTDEKMQVREWIGKTGSGIPITALILAISPRGNDPNDLVEALHTLHPYG